MFDFMDPLTDCGAKPKTVVASSLSSLQPSVATRSFAPSTNDDEEAGRHGEEGGDGGAASVWSTLTACGRTREEAEGSRASSAMTIEACDHG